MIFYGSSISSSLEFENLINVETSISEKGLPSFEIFGLISKTIEESKKRIINSFESIGSSFPLRNISINLSPAELSKEGTHYDLAIAATILQFSHGLKYNSKEVIFIGELSFDGSVRGVSNITYLILTAKNLGFRKFFISHENLIEVSFLTDIELYPLANLKDLLLINEMRPFKKNEESGILTNTESSFYKIIGNQKNKRVLSIALAGKHHLLLSGFPGSGKSLLAKSATDLLPDLEFKQALEVSKLYSYLGLPREKSAFFTPPFRSPHSSSSYSSIFGSVSKNLVPGEVVLANNGVLFLDEFPEFNRLVLEGLRAPLEDKKITLSRSKIKKTLDCDFILIGAMNPCKCGYFNHKKVECKCSPIEIKRYQNRISGPILDRIDINVTHNGDIENFHKNKEEQKIYSFEELKKLKDLIKVTRETLENVNVDNSINKFLVNMNNLNIRNFCDDLSVKVIKTLQENYSISNRKLIKILKLSKTISVFEGSFEVKSNHVLEALSLVGATA